MRLSPYRRIRFETGVTGFFYFVHILEMLPHVTEQCTYNDLPLFGCKIDETTHVTELC